MEPPPVRGPAVAWVYGGFFLTGMVTVLLGPLIPELETAWKVGHSEAGTLFVAQFSASSVGAVLSSFHLRRSLVGGYALMSVGLFTLTGGGWHLAGIAMALVGAGLGLAIPASNLWTAHTFAARRGAALSVLNLVWGLGAVSCPLLFAVLLGRAPATLALAAMGGVTGLVSILLLLHGSRRLRSGVVPTEPGGAKAGALVPLAAMLFLYVGVENAIGGWLVALADPLGAERSAVSLLIGSGFWGALLAGRLGAPFLLRRVSEAQLYTVSLVVAMVGTLVLSTADSRSGSGVGSVLAGLGLAALYPLTVSLLAARTASTGSRTTGWVFALGGLGGATLPWLTGRVAAVAGSSDRAFWVPFFGLTLLAAIFARLRSLGAGPAGAGEC